MNEQIAVDMMIKRVKEGDHTATVARDLLELDGHHVTRGEFSRLLQAEATALLNADHRHYAAV